MPKNAVDIHATPHEGLRRYDARYSKTIRLRSQWRLLEGDLHDGFAPLENTFSVGRETE
jgi:hypothetical protein